MSLGSAARVAAAAVPGCQHVLAGGTPCQDAARTHVSDDVVVLAVADGHGSKAYTHSDVGARLAVDIAVEVLAAWAPTFELHAALDDAAVATEIRGAVGRRLVFAWNRAVRHHAAMRGAMAGLAWPAEIDGAWSEAVKPYGTTLVAAVLTRRAALFLRLGDGEVLAVDARPRRIFPGSDKTMGQATESLCLRDCVERIQVSVQPTPRLVVLATDGVADPYDVDPTFEEVWGDDLRDRIQRHGWVQTALGLPRSLGALARDGDDCTVAICWLEGER
jgi:serine/threonine protein phosphatase PrpC